MTYKTVLLAAAVAVASPAMAYDHMTLDTTVQADSDAQETVNFADLDLTQRSGQHALKLRVIRASERVCIRSEGKVNIGRHLGGKENSCWYRTYRQAKSQVDTVIARAERGEQLPSMALVVSR